MGYFRILAAIPGFFVSSWLLMLLVGGWLHERLGAPPIGYVDSMLVTFTLWLAVAPLAAVGRK